MFNHKRDTRQQAEQGQANRSSPAPSQAPSPGFATQHHHQQQQQQPRQRTPISRAPPLARETPRPQPQPQPEIDHYANSQYATQAIIKYILQASLFAEDDALLTTRILSQSAPLAEAAFSQYRTGQGQEHGHGNSAYISRKSLIGFYIHFSKVYTTIRGLCLELDNLRSVWDHILECRESVVRMHNLGKLVPVPTPTNAATSSGNGNDTSTPNLIMPPKRKFQSDPRVIRNFLTVQAGWTTFEVGRYFHSNTTIENSFKLVEDKFQDAVDAFFAFARGLAGGMESQEPHQASDLLADLEITPGYDPDLLGALERIVVEPVLKEVRGLEREFWFVGRGCPDWEIMGEGELAKRLGQVGTPEERWVIETANEILPFDTEYQGPNEAVWDVQVGGEDEIIDLEREMRGEVEVDWAAVDRAAMMDQKEREKELRELAREIVMDLEREKERAEREWFREPGQNRHTRRKEGLPRTRREKQEAMDKLLRQDVVFMYDDHDSVRGWLARTDLE